ncbi:hypothetical protein JCGZ_21785 [Jatropha curcas]|uniref:Bet v I/Major latex protein domain-containing protein n=2 Tax=Jatropha curcas TaxID=180498 RepID=A0A067JP59_JATCU|nr:hypothetical protein JCGZ_21785 [Jatropha curcas]
MASNDGFVYTNKFQSTINLQSSIAEISKLFLGAAKLFPEKLSDIYKSITVISQIPLVWEIQYAKGCPVKKEVIRVDELDVVNLKLSYTVIGGDLLKFYKNIKVEAGLIPNESGCVVTRTYEFDKKNTKFGPAFLEFDIVKIIEVDRVCSNIPSKE